MTQQSHSWAWLISFSITSSRPRQPPRPLFWVSLVAQLVKNSPAVRETWVWYQVGKIPWRSEWLPTPQFWPGESVDCMVHESQRAGHDWATFTCTESSRSIHAVTMEERPPFYAWIQLRSVAQSCPTHCYPKDCSTTGFPVHHQLPGLAQTHVNRVSDAIQPSHPCSLLLLPSIFPSISVFSSE